MLLGKVGNAKWTGLSRNRRGGGGAVIEVFLEIPHDAVQEKNLNVFIIPLLTNMCYKIVA